MESWQQEALRQRSTRMGWCQCCGRPIQSEWYLDLAPFGLAAAACEGCVERHMHSNERRSDE